MEITQSVVDPVFPGQGASTPCSGGSKGVLLALPLQTKMSSISYSFSDNFVLIFSRYPRRSSGSAPDMASTSNYYLANFFLENCMKMKDSIGSRGKGGAFFCPPRPNPSMLIKRKRLDTFFITIEQSSHYHKLSQIDCV